MPRTSGDVPSSASFIAFGDAKLPVKEDKPNDDWDLPHATKHGFRGALTARYPRPVPREKEAELPKLRTRKSGIVGPELDLSVRYSNVPIALWYNIRHAAPSAVRSFMVIEDFHGDPKCWVTVATPKKNGKFSYREMHSEYYARTRPQKGCVRTRDWSDELVRRWTKFCQAFGIEYSGDRDYKFPKGILAEGGLSRHGEYYFTARWFPGNREPVTFRQLKVLGQRVGHHRSEAAKIRRAARRGVKEAVIRPVPADSVFTRRREVSAKEIRRMYFEHAKGKIPFKEFVKGFESRITLFPKRCREPVPGIVFLALKRLYEKPVKVFEDKPWFVKPGTPVDSLSYAIRMNQPYSKPAWRALARKTRYVLRYKDDQTYTSSVIPAPVMVRLPGKDPDVSRRVSRLVGKPTEVLRSSETGVILSW